MSDSVPKSASEVAEQAVRVHPDGDGYYDVVFGGMIAELGNEQSANIIASGLRRQLTTLLDSYATERISSDRRERERGWTPDVTPPFQTEILVAQGSDRRYIAWFKDAAEWDELKARYVRWWPLPGPADAEKENTR